MIIIANAPILEEYKNLSVSYIVRDVQPIELWNIRNDQAHYLEHNVWN